MGGRRLREWEIATAALACSYCSIGLFHRDVIIPAHAIFLQELHGRRPQRCIECVLLKSGALLSLAPDGAELLSFTWAWGPAMSVEARWEALCLAPTFHGPMTDV